MVGPVLGSGDITEFKWYHLRFQGGEFIATWGETADHYDYVIGNTFYHAFSSRWSPVAGLRALALLMFLSFWDTGLMPYAIVTNGVFSWEPLSSLSTHVWASQQL